MKFITEIDLRFQYKDKPFSVYSIDLDSRLTPGARAFLTDKRIEILNRDKDNKNKKTFLLNKDWRTGKLISKINSLESLFLMYGQEIIDKDIILAQEIIKLSKSVKSIEYQLDNKEIIKKDDFKECTGIKKEEAVNEPSICFEITDFHIQVEKAREIFIINRLRFLLLEIEPKILEIYEFSQEDLNLYENILENINKIINTLSQIICRIVGGGTCQRKN